MRLSRTLRRAGGAATAVVAGAAMVVSASPATAEPTWAPADTATVHPGVMTYTGGAQCTANFVYKDGAGNVYLGQAAHCSGTGGSTETNGCDSASLPLGTPVEAGDIKGTLAYNSWLTMQAYGETDPDTCAYNDLALIKIDPNDVGKVNPSVPTFGGPVGLDRDGTQAGERVFSYGNSELRMGLSPLSPKYGLSLGDSGGGWSHSVYTLSPGIPGDSGSGFLSADGTALGVLSTLALAPLPGSNGVGDLAKEIAYARMHGVEHLALVNGTEPFTGGGLPL